MAVSLPSFPSEDFHPIHGFAEHIGSFQCLCSMELRCCVYGTRSCARQRLPSLLLIIISHWEAGSCSKEWLVGHPEMGNLHGLFELSFSGNQNTPSLAEGPAPPPPGDEERTIHCTPPARAGRKQLHGVYYFPIIAFNISLRYAFKFVHSRAQSIDMPASLSMTV